MASTGSTGATGQRNSFSNPMSNWRPPSYGSVNANQSQWNMPSQNFQPQYQQAQTVNQQGNGNSGGTGGGYQPRTTSFPPPRINEDMIDPGWDKESGSYQPQPQPTDTGGGNAAPQLYRPPLMDGGGGNVAPVNNYPPPTISTPAFNYNTQPRNYGYNSGYRSGK